MIRTAFSTVACPEWTLSRVLEHASKWGFDGVELRSFVGGSMPDRSGGTGFASEPMLIAGEKIRDTVAREGVVISSVATGLTFDAPVFPPVIGHVLPTQHTQVEAGRRAVELASDAGIGAVRLYAFDTPKGSSRKATIRRIAGRLSRVCDHARHKDVFVCLENGGAFRRAEEIAEIIDTVDHPLIRASYDVRTGTDAGDTAESVINLFGPALHTLRLRDARVGDEGDTTLPLGEGDVPNEAFVRAASERGIDCWAVVNWDTQWLEGLAPSENVLPKAVERLYRWIGAAHATRGQSAA